MKFWKIKFSKLFDRSGIRNRIIFYNILTTRITAYSLSNKLEL